jgi:septal ring factor EnvC (AmiA/AmiB activator)
VLALYRQADAMSAQLEAITRERQQVFARQNQVQGNLAPLGRDGDEGRLRARYVTELERMENRLNELEREEKRVREEVNQLETLASRAIEALEN